MKIYENLAKEATGTTEVDADRINFLISMTVSQLEKDVKAFDRAVKGLHQYTETSYKAQMNPAAITSYAGEIKKASEAIDSASALLKNLGVSSEIVDSAAK